jgi:hypothetical protein
MLQVRVRPRSKVSVLEPADSGPWIARLKSPPVDGKANAELVALVARHFQCRRSAISIRSGESARLKLVRIEDA